MSDTLAAAVCIVIAAALEEFAKMQMMKLASPPMARMKVVATIGRLHPLFLALAQDEGISSYRIEREGRRTS